MSKSLPSSEWFLVGSILAIMLSLVVIAKVGAYRAASTLPIIDEKREQVLVTIDGAVAKPGGYLIFSGTTVEGALRKARPKPWANLKTLPLKQVIEEPLQLHVEELQEISISVCGAVVEPVEMILPAKSRICDLKSKISLTSEADKAFFRRRKILKDGDVVEVPKKNS